MQWYYAQGEKQVGPVSDDELHTLVGAGTITARTLVWHSGMANWAAYGTLPPQPAASQPPVVVMAQVEPTAAAEEPASAGGDGSTPNRDLMAHARAALASRWGLAIGVVVLELVINIAASIIPLGVGVIVSFLIAGPFAVGLAIFFLSVSRNEDSRLAMLFDGFARFGTTLAAYLLMVIFLCLWLLLFIIPGIIKSYSYSMTFYIIADDPSVGALEAITRSRAMMDGKKWKFFCLNMRFIGWALLCVLTCCIGFLWLIPYISTSTARFYDDVRGRAA